MKLSIIVPFYGVEQYFDEFLSSLLPITDNYEIILVNDGTKDKSREIAEKYSLKYENVILLDKKNGGLSSARNYGFQFAKGEYILFFDSDDYIEDKSVINEMLVKAIKTKSDIVVAPYYEFSNLERKKHRFDKTNFTRDLQSFEERTDVFFNNNVSFAVWNKLYNVSFLKENKLFFKDGIWFEDLEFVFRAFCVASRVSKVENILLGYRQREGSIMTTISPKINDKITVCDELMDYLKEHYANDVVILDKFKILYLRMFFSVIFAIVKSNSQKEYRQEIVNKSFSFTNLHEILKGNLKYKAMLSSSEKVFYYLLKYNILNKNNILTVQFLTKLRS